MSVIHRSESTKVFLIADHSLLGQSLATLLGQYFRCFVTDENYSPSNQIDLIKPHHTIFALDLNKPKNLKLLSELMGGGYHNTSVFAAEMSLLAQEKLFLAGVRGVLDAGMKPETLVRAVRKLCDGEIWISRQLTARMLSHVPKTGQSLSSTDDALLIKRLTPRQVQIAKECAANLGASNKILASKLHLGESSVRNALSALFSALELKNRNEFFLFLQRNRDNI
jgi:two-component system nitrate/nitrite response regulator NarL